MTPKGPHRCLDRYWMLILGHQHRRWEAGEDGMS